jgi:3,4-dihydroxyphenylacetate 2,3-dioxygenase
MMVGALGAGDCTARGVRYSDYESAAGTGQVHIWFDTMESTVARA